MDLILFGISHKTAPIEVRERFCLSKDEILDFLPELKKLDGMLGCLALSTCNRTEIYAVCSGNFNEDKIFQSLCGYKKIDISSNKESFYHKRNINAVHHLFRVSSSLESQIVGESQILGQIKDAYTLACKAQTTDTYINRLFHLAFKAAKTVRAKTNLGVGAVSIPSAAVELANHIYEKLSGKSVLLIGAGETGKLIAKYLLDRGIYSLKIANRTKSKAEELAKTYNAQVVDFNSLTDEFFKNDIIISATSGTDYVLSNDMLKPLIEKNNSKKVMAIDIAVPRNIDPELSKFGNIFLYDIDDLNYVVETNLKDRENEIPVAEKIIETAVDDFDKWLKEQKVIPTIKFLKDRFEDIRILELQKNKHCGICNKKSEVDQLTKRIINKILRAPIVRLVENTGCTEEELEYLRTLFAKDCDDNA